MGHPAYVLAFAIWPKGTSTLLQTTASSTAPCAICWNWSKLRWTHSWAHAAASQIRGRSEACRIFFKPRLCSRCIPLLEVAPRSSDYYLDWVGASTIQLESQPSWTVYLIIYALSDLLKMGLASTAVEATTKSMKGTHPSKEISYPDKNFFLLT